MLDLRDSGSAAAQRPEAGEIARTLADFVHDTQDTDIPPRIRDRARHHILDSIGIAVASAQQHFAKRAFDGLGLLAAAGPVPVLGMPARWAPRDAAMLNGLLCHGLDFDDTHLRGVIHPTTAQFPAALSAAVLAGTSTREMVTAYILGVEAAVRLASVAKGGFHAVGFHPTGVCNVFAAALAAGRLFGLSPDALCHAQGIALSLASGTLEFLEDGAGTKRLHPGWSAAAGLTAAALAKSGCDGVTAPYSGRFGLFRTYLGGDDSECDYAAATAGLGEAWELLNTAIKPYPACHLTHGCIDAAIALAHKHNLKGGDIASVTALVARQMVATICEPIANKRRPKNSYDAQFSIPYLVATALLYGRMTVAELDEGYLCDPDIVSLAAKVNYDADPESGFPQHYSGEVIIETTDGRRLRERRQVNSGAPVAPVSNADIVAKFSANAATALASGAVAQLRDLILDAEDEARPATAFADDIARLQCANGTTGISTSRA